MMSMKALTTPKAKGKAAGSKPAAGCSTRALKRNSAVLWNQQLQEDSENGQSAQAVYEDSADLAKKRRLQPQTTDDKAHKKAMDNIPFSERSSMSAASLNSMESDIASRIRHQRDGGLSNYKAFGPEFYNSIRLKHVYPDIPFEKVSKAAKDATLAQFRKLVESFDNVDNQTQILGICLGLGCQAHAVVEDCVSHLLAHKILKDEQGFKAKSEYPMAYYARAVDRFVAGPTVAKLLTKNSGVDIGSEILKSMPKCGFRFVMKNMNEGVYDWNSMAKLASGKEVVAIDHKLKSMFNEVDFVRLAYPHVQSKIDGPEIENKFARDLKLFIDGKHVDDDEYEVWVNKMVGRYAVRHMSAEVKNTINLQPFLSYKIVTSKMNAENVKQKVKSMCSLALRFKYDGELKPTEVDRRLGMLDKARAKVGSGIDSVAAGSRGGKNVVAEPPVDLVKGASGNGDVDADVGVNNNASSAASGSSMAMGNRMSGNDMNGGRFTRPETLLGDAKKSQKTDNGDVDMDRQQQVDNKKCPVYNIGYIQEWRDEAQKTAQCADEQDECPYYASIMATMVNCASEGFAKAFPLVDIAMWKGKETTMKSKFNLLLLATLKSAAADLWKSQDELQGFVTKSIQPLEHMEEVRFFNLHHHAMEVVEAVKQATGIRQFKRGSKTGYLVKQDSKFEKGLQQNLLRLNGFSTVKRIVDLVTKYEENSIEEVEDWETFCVDMHRLGNCVYAMDALLYTRYTDLVAEQKRIYVKKAKESGGAGVADALIVADELVVADEYDEFLNNGDEDEEDFGVEIAEPNQHSDDDAMDVDGAGDSEVVVLDEGNRNGDTDGAGVVGSQEG